MDLLNTSAELAQTTDRYDVITDGYTGSDGTSERIQRIKRYLLVGNIGLRAAIIALGLCNWFVLAIFIRCKKMKTAFNILVTTITVADIAVCHVVLPLEIIAMTTSVFENSLLEWCTAINVVKRLVNHISLFGLAAMSVIRACASMRSNYLKLKMKCALGLSLAICGVALVIAVTTSSPRSTFMRVCMETLGRGSPDKSTQIIIATYAIAIGVTIGCHVVILAALIVKKYKKRQHNTQTISAPTGMVVVVSPSMPQVTMATQPPAVASGQMTKLEMATKKTLLVYAIGLMICRALPFTMVLMPRAELLVVRYPTYNLLSALGSMGNVVHVIGLLTGNRTFKAEVDRFVRGQSSNVVGISTQSQKTTNSVL